MKLDDYIKKSLKEDPEFRKEYEKEDLPFGISQLISSLRMMEEMSQEDLAETVATKQSGISRLERGNSLPSLSFLEKVASALGYRIQIRFISRETGAVLDSDGGVQRGRIPKKELASFHHHLSGVSYVRETSPKKYKKTK